MKISQAKDIPKGWKIKAIERGQRLKSIRKRVKELTASRDHWRRKYFSLKNGQREARRKAKRHQYSLCWVQFCLRCHQYGGLGLRACRHCLNCIYLCLNIQGRVPSHVSIRNWIIKQGYYQVHDLAKPKGEWVIWVDESVVLGAESILLVLGLPLQEWKFERPVCVSDSHVLWVESRQGWTVQQIQSILQKVKDMVDVQYVVSDQGINLCKAYAQVGLTHIPDCSHVLANGMEKLYKNDPTFDLFIRWAAQLRARWAMSRQKVAFMPPAHRTKARFANVFPLVRWAKDVLNRPQNTPLVIPQEVKDELAFLEQHRSFIEELSWIDHLSSSVAKILKTQGYNSHSRDLIQQCMNHLGPYITDTIKAFMDHLKGYLENLDKQSLGMELKPLICCSDVIESTFGKFKQKIHPRSPFGMTQFLLSFPNFTQTLNLDLLKTALESSTLVNLAELSAKRDSFFHLKTQFLGKNGT